MNILVIGCSGFQGYVLGIAESLKELMPELEMTVIVKEDPLHKPAIVSKRIPFSRRIVVKRDNWLCILARLYREMEKYSIVIIGCRTICPSFYTLFSIFKKAFTVSIMSGHEFIPRISRGVGIANLLILQWPEQKLLYRGGVVVGPIYEKPLYKPVTRDSIVFIIDTPRWSVGESVRDILARKLECFGSIKFCDTRCIHGIDLDKAISCARVVVTDDYYIAFYSRLAYSKRVVILRRGVDKRDCFNAWMLSRKLGIEYLCIDSIDYDVLAMSIDRVLKKNTVEKYHSSGRALAKKLLYMIL